MSVPVVLAKLNEVIPAANFFPSEAYRSAISTEHAVHIIDELNSIPAIAVFVVVLQ